jgi:hypothetical protein
MEPDAPETVAVQELDEPTLIEEGEQFTEVVVVTAAGWTIRLNGSLAPGNWLSPQLQVTPSEISRE